MTALALAPVLQAFFTQRLQQQLRASRHTITAYRDTFRLLLNFAKRRIGKDPCDLLVADLDASLIAEFLHYLETERGNSIGTRNARLAAIRSFFRFAATQLPDLLCVIQRVLSIPQKRNERTIVSFLTRPETDAMLAAPDRATWIGRRDAALLLLAVQTGLRVSELIGLRVADLELGTGAHVRCTGKGRKQRSTPLTSKCSGVLRDWLGEQNAGRDDVLFPSRRGGHLSRDAVERLVTKYADRAATTCPSLAAKRVTPHVLRHTNAVDLLQAGVDRSVIALWLGHESVETTQIYLHADLALKERALATTAPVGIGRRRFRPGDKLLAYLDSL
jgi:site-specific recombinase XerD